MIRSRFPRLLAMILVLVLPTVLLVGGFALAQLGLPATEPGGDPPKMMPPSYDSGDPSFDARGVLPPDENTSDSIEGNSATFAYYTVAGPELQPRTTTNVQAYTSNGCVYMSSGTGTGLLTGTGMHIPDNAVLKYIRLYYYDTNASAGVDAFLTRYAPGSAVSDRLSTGSTNAFSGGYGFVVSNEITETVDNSAYAYHLYGWPDSNNSNLQVCGIRVAYYAPFSAAVFLPMVSH
jgi:hypothetical protein